MYIQTLACRHCGHLTLVKYGLAPNGKQKYLCRTCGRQSREHPQPPGYSPERREEILRAYQERASLRGLERIFGVSRSTVIGWLKKSPATPTTPNNLTRS
jgi:transposase-like protein